MYYRAMVASVGMVILSASSAQGQSNREQSFDQAICGPRCVKYVLDFYKPENGDDLVGLIRELQWPNMERGTSLADIGRALEKRGISTRAVRVPRGVFIDWRFPVIVHCQPNSSKIGHFVVALPADDCDSPPLSDSGGDRIMVLEGGPKDERVTAGSATSLAAF